MGFAQQLGQAQGFTGAESASLGGAFWELASAAVVDDLFAEGLDVGSGFGDGVVVGGHFEGLAQAEEVEFDGGWGGGEMALHGEGVDGHLQAVAFAMGGEVGGVEVVGFVVNDVPGAWGGLAGGGLGDEVDFASEVGGADADGEIELAIEVLGGGKLGPEGRFAEAGEH